MNITTFLISLTPPIVRKVIRAVRLRIKKYHGQWKIDQKIEKYINYNDGYYVELGAVDGIGLSNTLYYELNRNWGGILVEPVPHNFVKCLANRSNVRNKIFCNACVSFEYKDKFVEMVYAHYMSTAVGLDSDIPDPVAHAESGQRFLATTSEKLFKFGAVAVPLNELLEKANAPKMIDLLSLDVEGAELEVLKGIDHRIYRFKLMCVESRDPARITNYLKAFDYELIDQISPHDYLYICKDYKVSLQKDDQITFAEKSSQALRD